MTALPVPSATDKLCSTCGTTKPLSEFRRGYNPCRQCSSEYNKRWRQANREHLAEYDRNYHEANREAKVEYDRQRRTANRERLSQAERERYPQRRDLVLERLRRASADLKAQVLAHYGESCACCGSRNKLSIDHVNGDGKNHRLEIFGKPAGGGGARFYRWLIRNNFPEGFQALCLSCNHSKGSRPHCLLHRQDSPLPAPEGDGDAG